MTKLKKLKSVAELKQELKNKKKRETTKSNNKTPVPAPDEIIQPKLYILDVCKHCELKCKIMAIKRAELVCCPDFRPVENAPYKRKSR